MRLIPVFFVAMMLIPLGLYVHGTSAVDQTMHRQESYTATEILDQFLGIGPSYYSSRVWNTSGSLVNSLPENYTNVTLNISSKAGTYIFIPGHSTSTAGSISNNVSLSNISGWASPADLNYSISQGNWTYRMFIKLSSIVTGGSGYVGVAEYLMNSTTGISTLAFSGQNNTNVFTFTKSGYREVNVTVSAHRISTDGKILLTVPYFNLTTTPSLIALNSGGTSLNVLQITLGVGGGTGSDSYFMYPFYGVLSGEYSPQQSQISINGAEMEGNNGTFRYDLTPGVYWLNITHPYYQNFSSRVVIQSGSCVTFNNIRLIKLYNVTVIEKGLPQGVKWNISIGSDHYSTNGSAIEEQVTNGTFKVGVSKIVQVGYNRRFVAIFNSTTVNVSGGSVSVSFTYTEEFYLSVGVNSKSLGVVSPESGWYEYGNRTNIRAIANEGYRFYFWVGEGNGSYSGANSSANVSMISPVNETAWFYPLGERVYNLTFVEYGISNGTQWGISINGIEETSYSPAIDFLLENGTYHFHVDRVPGYMPEIINSTVVVSGNNVIISIKFIPVLYSVEFVESGLPADRYPWYIVVNTTVISSMSNTVETMLPNGTYRYHIPPIGGYAVSPLNYNITINGSANVYYIHFSQVYYDVRFVVSGYVNGTKWGVTVYNSSMELGNITNSSAVIVMKLPYGSYNYTAYSDGLIGEYNVSFSVQSGNLTIGIVFLNGGTVPASGGSSGAGYLIYAYIGIAAFLVAIIYLYQTVKGGGWDDMFIIYRDGRMMKHYTRRFNPNMDQELISASLLAIQKAIKETTGVDNLRQIHIGGAGISIISGNLISVALMGNGKLSERRASGILKTIEEIERIHADELSSWNGEEDKIGWLDRYSRLLY